ncbi:MAG: hypothetical protein ACLT98_10600 [Eggerthellaceae bacterium]
MNAVQTEVPYERAIDLAGFTGSETAIDAYCGTGTIGLVRQRGARQVIGDTVASAVRDAREREAQRRRTLGSRWAMRFMRERRRRRCRGRAADGSAARRPSEEFLAAAGRWRPGASSTSRATRLRRCATWPFAPARLCRSHGAAGRHVPSYGSHRDDRAGGARRGLL